MKREIKFRYYDPFNAEIRYCSMEYADHLSKFFIEYDAALQGDNQPILMQFTGLHDKNGKEIFEGDVLRCHDDYIGSPSTENHEVIFNGRAQFKLKGGQAFDYYASIEIIGNIYQNPELLSPPLTGNVKP